MKRLVLFSLLAMLLLTSIAAAAGDGGDITPIFTPEQFGPRVFLDPHSRIVIDDCNEPGAIYGGMCTEELVERIENYAFEGEQIIWDVLVWDKNGIDKVTDVFVTLNDEIEANCHSVSDCVGTPVDTEHPGTFADGWATCPVSGGNYGGIGTNTCLVAWDGVTQACTEETRDATFTVGADGMTTTSIIINYLDGIAETGDGFEVKDGDIVLCSVVDTTPTNPEVWKNLVCDVDFDGVKTLTIHPTSTAPWSLCNTYGQLAVHSITYVLEVDSCEVLNTQQTCEQTEGCYWYGNFRTIEVWEGEEHVTEYNPRTMQWYQCAFTVETPESMHGEYVIVANARDLFDLTGQSVENEYWFLNPVIALGMTGSVNFGTVRPGATVKSTSLRITNEAEAGSGVLLDMYIAGTDFYDPSHSAAMCPDSNVLRLGNFRYYAALGAYKTCTHNEIVPQPEAEGPAVDSECYVTIPYYVTGAGDPGNNGMQRIIAGTTLLGGEYPAGNVLSPGADISINFKLKVPEPCNGGTFSQGTFKIFGEAI